MLEQTERVTGVDRDNGQPPHLPDLAAVDLRTLRFMDDPELVAAVERVLRQPRELGESWVESD
ncbi:hypothetical protein [Streptomyces vilmorinianum]|uniref:hypothetical protein n=1 Tax=Streptomyces vilmorinianum TaxID=3051092 RepID=UPI0010FB5299|nr:hypothetical protein [Streptomyces vilmorinianum]